MAFLEINRRHREPCQGSHISELVPATLKCWLIMIDQRPIRFVEWCPCTDSTKPIEGRQGRTRYHVTPPIGEGVLTGCHKCCLSILRIGNVPCLYFFVIFMAILK